MRTASASGNDASATDAGEGIGIRDRSGQPARPSRERCNRCQRRNRDKAYVTKRGNRQGHHRCGNGATLRTCLRPASPDSATAAVSRLVNTMYGMSTETVALPSAAAAAARRRRIRSDTAGSVQGGITPRAPRRKFAESGLCCLFSPVAVSSFRR